MPDKKAIIMQDQKNVNTTMADLAEQAERKSLTELGKPKKEPHPYAGVSIFRDDDQNVCSSSNADYIYLLLDDKDKQLLMMMKVPHIRKTLMDGEMLNPEAVAELVEWSKDQKPLAIQRIRRLCFFGAIVTKQGTGWITNPKLSSIIALNK